MSDLLKLIRKVFGDQPVSLILLWCALFLFATIGFSLVFTAFAATVVSKNYLSLPLCFDNSCITYFLKEFDQTFVIAKGTLDFLVAVATTGGIIVALLNYLSSANTSALSNHIAHFSIFQEYINSEVSKRNRVSPTSIDVLKLYNLIFSTSRRGRTDISIEYINFISKLNLLIDESNNQSQHAVNG